MTQPINLPCSCNADCILDPKTCDPLSALGAGLGSIQEIKCIRLLQQMLDLLPMGVWVFDVKGEVIQSNALGRKQLAALGASVDCVDTAVARWRKTGIPVQADEWPHMLTLKDGKNHLSDEIGIEFGNGSTRFIESSAMSVHDGAGRIQAVMVVNQDISERVATEEALRSLAETDMLTGANTRRKFFQLLDLEIERHTRYSRVLSAIIFDTDHFKRINDTYGHLVGDEVLMELGRLLATNIRKADHFCRLGGEEFVVLLPETGLDEAVASAEKLRHLIEQACMPTIGNITCSFGVSQFKSGESGSAFLRRLDETMYRAKQAGRNQVAFQ